MSKDDVFEAEGTVEEVLPNTVFKVKLQHVNMRFVSLFLHG